MTCLCEPRLTQLEADVSELRAAQLETAQHLVPIQSAVNRCLAAAMQQEEASRRIESKLDQLLSRKATDHG